MIAILMRNRKTMILTMAVVAVVALWIPVSHTVVLGKKYYAIRHAVSMLHGGAPPQQQQSTMDKMLLRETNLPEKLFEQVATSCQSHGVRVREIETLKEAVISEVVIQDQRMILEGSFIHTLQSLSAVSDTLFPVKIASLRFERVEVSKKPVLVSQVMFQAVKLSEHE